MLNRMYYLQNGAPVFGPGATNGITIAHEVDGRPGRALALVGQLYADADSPPFCLALKDYDDPVVAIRQVLLLFFHPSYELTEKGRVVFVWAPPGRGEEIVRRMEELFAAERIEVELFLVAKEAGRVNLLHGEDDDPAGDYHRYCMMGYCPQDLFLLTGRDLSWWHRQLDRVVTCLAEHHPSFYGLATDRLAAGKLAAHRDREIVRMSEDLRAMQQLLELSSKQDEVEYILRFYRNEYEILPLWYKRLGHLIKVVQGKRSFRSLFDKSVKKYKD